MLRKLYRLATASADVVLAVYVVGLVAVMAAFLLLGGPRARGAEPEADRARRVRVALALAAPPAGAGARTPAEAPAPRPGLADYAAGYAEAVARASVLVCYCGTSGPKVEGAVTAKGPAGHAAGIVVAVPGRGGMVVDAELPAGAHPAAVAQAVNAARRKADRPPAGKAAPRPLDWHL